MTLPSPLPDNPKRWEGWRNYNSKNPYERLCLSYADRPSTEQIEGNCRQLLVWWQKKLPLKNQPSNPITQMLRAALDEAPEFLIDARTKLLDPDHRQRIDKDLESGVKKRAFAEFSKFFDFVTSNGVLDDEQEQNLFDVGSRAGLTIEEMRAFVDRGVEEREIRRTSMEEEKANAEASSDTEVKAGDLFEDFRRLLRLSGLDEDAMTDDQRDALCNMGENLGLTGGQCEDLIDEYLDEMSDIPLATSAPAKTDAAARPVPAPTPKKTTPSPASKSTDPAANNEPKREITEVTRALEREKNPDFKNSIGMALHFVPSGVFSLGSDAAGAPPNEQPVSRTTVTCFYMSRHPITNAQYEQFDPSHRSKRAPWAGDNHPVVYVSSREAEQFCKWLSSQERRNYRLPTEAEWEYAARGTDGRSYPWGEKFNRGDLANFADANTSFAWREVSIDDGYAETSPVGNYPRGASPFGLEDMAGNVHEWCLDHFVEYQNRERTNPRGPTAGSKRIYRGGSWKSRASSLRTSARAFNLPEYASNDVGFRVVCEVNVGKAE